MTSQAKIVVSAEDRASKVLQGLRGQLASTSASARDLSVAAGLSGAAFAALASATGLVAFVKSLVDAADALNDVADATGASIESLSGLERVARLNGGTLDDVSGILIKFNKALGDATAPGSAAAQVFTALGLSAKELQAADPAEALQKTAQALAGFADDGNKARVVQELFGKSIKDAAPFLKDLAEAGELNGKVTREQAEQAERFNKTLFALQTAAADAGRAITLGLGGALAEVIERYKVAQQVFGNLNGILSAGLFNKLNFADAAEGLREYNKQITDLDARIQKVRDGSDGFRGRFAEQRVKALQDERAELAKVADYYRNLVNAGSAGQGRGTGGAGLPQLRLPTAAPAGADKIKAEIDKNAEALGRYIGELYREAEAATAVTERMRALNALRSAGAAGELPQVRALVLALADEADKREQGLAFAKAMTAEMERQAAEQRGLDDAINQFSGRTAAALRAAQQARLEARLGAGEVFSPEELQRIQEGIAGIKPVVDKTFDAANKTLERFAENVQDALGTTIEATLRGDFDNIGRLWSNLLLKMASEALAADLANALFGNMLKAPGAGVAGGGSGLFGSLLGAIGLGIGRASGGTVNPMSVQPVNERGFELFRSGGQDWLLAGADGGKVIPNPGAGGGAVTVVQHITIGAGVSRNEVMAAMSVTQSRTLAAVADAQRRGSRQAMQ